MTRFEIHWKGHLVGWVENLSCENFNVFGRWVPGDFPETEVFLQKLREEQELIIQVGEMDRAFLDSEPGKEIEFKFLRDFDRPQVS